MNDTGNTDREEVTQDGHAEPLQAEPLQAEALEALSAIGRRPNAAEIEIETSGEGASAPRDGSDLEEVTQDVDAEPLQAEPLQAEALEALNATGRRPRAAAETETSGEGARSPRRDRYRDLLRSGTFLRLWGSQAVSNAGDWVYVIAVATAVAGRLEGAALAKAIGLLLAAQAGPAALFGFTFGGSIADRFDRRRVMVITDLIRCAAVASILFVSTPAMLHLVLVAAILGICGSMFQPAIMATLPETVGQTQLLRANAVVTGTYHLAIMVGPALGAALVAVFGPGVAITVNAASFGVSALLLAGVRTRCDGAHDREAWTPMRDLVDGLAHAARSVTVRGVIVVMGLALFLLPAKAPAEIVLVREHLTGGSAAAVATALGVLTAAFGAGMVAGSALAPLVASRVRREAVMTIAIATIGVGYLAAATAGSVTGLAIVWLAVGTAGGALNVAYETLLQEATPEGFRGRVFSLADATQDGTYLLGAIAVGAFGSMGFGALGIATLVVAGAAAWILGVAPRRRALTVVDDVV